MTGFELTSSLGALLISLAVQSIFFAALLWCAMKILRKKGTLAALITASVVAALIGFIPFIGPLLGLIALILLINRFTSAGKFSSVLMVAIAWILGITANIGLLILLDIISIKL